MPRAREGQTHGRHIIVELVSVVFATRAAAVGGDGSMVGWRRKEGRAARMDDGRTDGWMEAPKMSFFFFFLFLDDFVFLGRRWRAGWPGPCLAAWECVRVVIEPGVGEAWRAVEKEGTTSRYLVLTWPLDGPASQASPPASQPAK